MATKTETLAENAEAEGEGEEGKKTGKGGISKFIPKLSRKLMIIVGGALVLFCAAGGGAYFFFGGHGKAEQASAAAAATQSKPPTFLDMPDVLVNLASSNAGDRTQYLKVKVTLELPDQAMSALIEPVMPRLMDAFQTYLRELRPTDLEGSAGLYRLKEELTRRVNASIAPNHVTAVLFKEIVIQ